MVAVSSDIPDDTKYDYALKNALPLLSNSGLDGAMMVVEMEIARDPESCEAWAAKADILYLQGRNRYALQCIECALRLNPSDALAWTTKGNILYKLGRYEESIICYNKAIDLEPLFVKAWHNKKLAVEMQLKNSRPQVTYIDTQKPKLDKRSY